MKPVAVTIADFCKLYGVQKTKTYELINEGRVEAIKIGNRTLITTASADALIADARRVAA